ncbi:pseudouridine synthase [Jannaschia donghaensis]|uniref:Pseudouridine synthase n=1 Tax=Jannaschia donghaensis TaxID=420998 RepID=A0A0M6YEV1_9RHOB|nr:pseudouridine synthase [Jannaschia donghaensis]CTQ48464.1 Ribosomal large subunit pseudouridine synthase B [Jannaschia donghaensis]
MTDNTDRAGERIAKIIARAGLASRRDAEKMVADLRVKVNGKTVSNVAHNVIDGDRVSVDGKPLPKADGARLWLYHKPAGLVTTEKDEKDRETVFDALPDDLGRVLSVGRLDLNSEGLLLLTNDGELKRQLELPSTGWLRRYRVRVNGKPNDASLERLRAGITVEGDDGPETFAGMDIVFDRQQGANAWLTVGLREGRNREIRRAFAAVDMYVNRLIRVSYGPFQLGNLPAGEVEEIKPRIVKEQLGATWDGDLAESRRETAVPETKDARAGKDGSGDTRGRKPRPSGDRLVDQGRGTPRDDAPRGKPAGKPRTGSPAEARVARAAAKGDRPRTGKPPVTRNDGDGSRPPRSARPGGDGPRKFSTNRPPRKAWEGDPDRPSRDGDRAPWSKDDRGDRRDGKPGGTKRPDDKPKETKSERTARLRADSSISLRKGGQRGRGIAKPKKAPSSKRMKKPGDGED